MGRIVGYAVAHDQDGDSNMRQPRSARTGGRVRAQGQSPSAQKKWKSDVHDKS